MPAICCIDLKAFLSNFIMSSMSTKQNRCASVSGQEYIKGYLSGGRQHGTRSQPTEPSNLRLIRPLTSDANSCGSSSNTSLQKPPMMRLTASSASMPLCWK